MQVFVQDTNGVAWVKYQFTAGEVIRAFALDVTVDQGVIFGVSDFLVGVSKSGAKGYGIFPASFRDHATVNSRTNVTFDLTQYSPAAVVADYPADTKPGLNSNGITIEFGALWDTSVPAAVPGSSGTLCALHLTRAANVSVAPNNTSGENVSKTFATSNATSRTTASSSANSSCTFPKRNRNGAFSNASRTTSS